MQSIVLASETDWDGWRRAARALALSHVSPDQVTWSVGGPARPLPDGTGSFNVPRALVALASIAFQARDQDRFALLYSLVWRACAGEKVLEQEDDPDLRHARELALAVRRDAHRMRTHLRFMAVPDADGERFLGWYAPAHYVLEANAQLISRRFPALRFSIITPDASAHWDRHALRFGTGLRHVEDDDTLLAWWDAHHAAVLRDTQVGTSVPEAEALDEAPRPPDHPPLGPVVLTERAEPALVAAMQEARACHRCHLSGPATQTVFGEGMADAPVMFIGEQPGDQEDVIGRPFVGPAGQVLDRALEEAGIDRRLIYITNAVKHFKFTPRGKRRIHATPDTAEIEACSFWLDVERVRLQPRLLVLMGASAARAILGRQVTISRERGRPIRMDDGQMAFVTVHPSFLLRVPDEAGKAREYRAFVRDLETVRELLEAR